MKRISSYIKAIFFGAFAVVALSCSDDDEATPVITNVRLTHPDTKDISLAGAPLGFSIVIQGKNLGSTRQLFLNDYEVILNPAYVTNSNIVVTIPDEVPTVATHPDVSNTLRLVTAGGYNLSYDFETLPPPAIIESVSNEMAKEGEELTLTGKYFFFVNEVVFPGDVLGTNISTAPDGTWLKVTVPAGVDPAGGHIFVASNSGVSAQSRWSQFNDTTGIFMNFDHLKPLGWGIDPANMTDETPGNIIQPLDEKFGLINTVIGKNYGWSNAKVLNMTYWGDEMFPKGDGYAPAVPIANMDIRMEIAVEKPTTSLEGIELLVWFPLDGAEYSYAYPLAGSVKSLDGKWYTVSVPLSSLVATGDKKLSTYGQMLGQGTHEIRVVINNATANDIDGVITIDNIRIVNNTR
jgi:hypothetical protein